jgi:hypothetical protein
MLSSNVTNWLLFSKMIIAVSTLKTYPNHQVAAFKKSPDVNTHQQLKGVSIEI